MTRNVRAGGNLRWSLEMMRDVLTRRRCGQTLEAIAVVYGVTRERIRQVEAKARRKLAVKYRHEIGRAARDALAEMGHVDFALFLMPNRREYLLLVLETLGSKATAP